jgi:hypothetical protein
MVLSGCTLFSNGEERAMLSSKRICKFIRDLTTILAALRVLAGELVFTAAAIYGVYQAFLVLTR